MDLLNLSPEDTYYLTLLILLSCASAKTGEGIFYSCDSDAVIRTIPYAPPPLPEASPVARPGGEGLFSTIIETITLPFFAPPPEPAPPKPTLTTRQFPLSHHLLIEKNGNDIICTLVAPESFSHGNFGRLYYSPRTLLLSANDSRLSVIDKTRVCKLQGYTGRARFAESEFRHLHSQEADSRLLTTDSAPAEYLRNIRLPVGATVSDLHFDWIIMPKIEGVSLDKLNIDVLTVSQKIKIATSLIVKLQRLHYPLAFGSEHIHNDIKPGNIMVDGKFHTEFCDWGAATHSEEPVLSFSRGYTPYKAFAKPAKKEADIHCLGITLFQLFLDPVQIPPGQSRWKLFPKGITEYTEKHWNRGKKMNGLQATKLLEGSVGRTLYQMTHGDVVTAKVETAGLNKKQAKDLFVLLKGLRNKTAPLSLEESYERMHALAQELPDYDSDYYDTLFNGSSHTRVTSCSSAACSSTPC